MSTFERLQMSVWTPRARNSEVSVRRWPRTLEHPELPKAPHFLGPLCELWILFLICTEHVFRPWFIFASVWTKRVLFMLLYANIYIFVLFPIHVDCVAGYIL